MFDHRHVRVEVFPPALERALQGFLGLPTSPVVLGESFRAHGRPARLVDEPPGIEVPDRLARLLESGAEHLAAAKAAAVAQNRAVAAQARALAAFAACRPAELFDRHDDEVGSAAASSRAARPPVLTEVSEWAVDEVMATLGLPSRTAGLQLAESITLVEQLPATLAVLEKGVISWAHVRVMVDLVAPLSDELRPGVEAQLMAKAPGRTAAQLRATARRAVLRADASQAAKRLARAIRDRSVRMYADRDGMAGLTALMSAPVVRACYRRLEALAEASAVPGDGRTKDQRMTDCLTDLLLGNGSGQPPVQVTLAVVAPAGTLLGGDEPGELDGDPISAVQVREVAYALGLLPRPVESAPDEPAEQGVADLGGLLGLRTTAGTGLAELPRIALVDEMSGQLLALTDAFEVHRVATCGRRACRRGRRACTHPPSDSGLGPPPPTDGYEPSAPLDRFVRFRERRCLFPGCRARPMRCDLHHVVRYPVGPTSAENLCCLCRHHHRLGHQAPGWKMRRLGDGAIEWTLPSGERVTTRPTPFGTDDLPPSAPPPAPTVPPTDVADDPPPF